MPARVVASVDGRDGLVSDGIEGTRQTSKTGMEEVVRSLISVDKDKVEQPRSFCRCTGNILVLALTAFLFALITGVQYYFGGVVTHSQALLADCNSMLVDTLTYFLNIGAECAVEKWKKRLRLVAPAVSLLVLLALTIFCALLPAIDTIRNPDGPGDGVNPWIVFAFGVGGLIFDIISIVAFYINAKKEQAKNGLPVNMLAAFFHVGADWIRSLTTTVESILLFKFKNWNGDLIDAWAAVIITVVICIAIIYGYIEVILDIRRFLREESASDSKA